MHILSKNIKREISLNKLGLLDEFSKPVKVIYDFLDLNLMGLNKYEHKKYYNVEVFGNSKENIVVEYHTDEKNIYLHNSRIFNKLKILTNSYDNTFNWHDLTELLLWWVINYMKMDINNIYVLERAPNTKDLILKKYEV